MNEEVLIDW